MYTICPYIKTDLFQLGTRNILLVIQEDGVCVAMHHGLCSTARQKRCLNLLNNKEIMKKPVSYDFHSFLYGHVTVAFKSTLLLLLKEYGGKLAAKIMRA